MPYKKMKEMIYEIKEKIAKLVFLTVLFKVVVVVVTVVASCCNKCSVLVK